MSDQGIYEFCLEMDGAMDEDVVRALHDAGMDDSIFMYVTDEPDFPPQGLIARSGASLEEVVRAAIAQVESVPGLKVRKVDVDELLELKDVAKRLGRSRWRAKKLLEEVSFPPPAKPAEDGYAAAWLWADVADWAGDPEPRREQAIAASITASLR